MSSTSDTALERYGRLRLPREGESDRRDHLRNSFSLLNNLAALQGESNNYNSSYGGNLATSRDLESPNVNENTFMEGSDPEEEGIIDKALMNIDMPINPTSLGLKEIGNLASWTVSSCKTGCGVEALREEDTDLFWQSDGPQPHYLNIHFSRFVSIVLIRIFLDFDADESYTPTRILLLAGTGYHDLIPFNSLNFEQPRGWINVPLDDVGGGEDGKTLRAFLLQVKILENHQNGKDTHIRGFKIYAKNHRLRSPLNNILISSPAVTNSINRDTRNQSWLTEPDWMIDAQIR